VDNRGAGWTIGNGSTATTIRSFTHNSTAGNGGPGLILRHQRGTRLRFGRQQYRIQAVRDAISVMRHAVTTQHHGT